MEVGTLLDGLGIGSLVTTGVSNWVEARTEVAKWLRDRHAAYSPLAKELLSTPVWRGTTGPDDAYKIMAEAVLLTDDDDLAESIAWHFAGVDNAVEHAKLTEL